MIKYHYLLWSGPRSMSSFGFCSCSWYRSLHGSISKSRFKYDSWSKCRSGYLYESGSRSKSWVLPRSRSWSTSRRV